MMDCVTPNAPKSPKSSRGAGASEAAGACVEKLGKIGVTSGASSLCAATHATTSATKRHTRRRAVGTPRMVRRREWTRQARRVRHDTYARGRDSTKGSTRRGHTVAKGRAHEKIVRRVEGFIVFSMSNFVEHASWLPRRVAQTRRVLTCLVNYFPIPVHDEKGCGVFRGVVHAAPIHSRDGGVVRHRNSRAVAVVFSGRRYFFAVCVVFVFRSRPPRPLS